MPYLGGGWRWGGGNMVSQCESGLIGLKPKKLHTHTHIPRPTTTPPTQPPTQTASVDFSLEKSVENEKKNGTPLSGWTDIFDQPCHYP